MVTSPAVCIALARTKRMIHHSRGECVPDECLEEESPRSMKSDGVARKRSREFWLNVYARNPVVDPDAFLWASPDYALIIRRKLYPRLTWFAPGGLTRITRMLFTQGYCPMTACWIP